MTDLQEWYTAHVLAPGRRQLIITVNPKEEIPRSATGIRVNNAATYRSYDTRSHRHSLRSSAGASMERVPRASRRPEVSDDDDGHVSLLQTKSESKLRCLTTKRKQNATIRATRSDTLHAEQTFDRPDGSISLDRVIKSFESIEIADKYELEQSGSSLKLLLEIDHDPSTKSFTEVSHLKQFKESCLLYNVASIQ